MLEQAYNRAGKRMKSSLKKVTIFILSWGTRHKAALYAIQDSLQNAVKLTFPEMERVLCLYTDASEEMGAAVDTKTKEEILKILTESQQHELLAFHGEKFVGA